VAVADGERVELALLVDALGQDVEDREGRVEPADVVLLLLFGWERRRENGARRKAGGRLSSPPRPPSVG
jgi:hypothetical protein